MKKIFWLVFLLGLASFSVALPSVGTTLTQQQIDSANFDLQDLNASYSDLRIEGGSLVFTIAHLSLEKVGGSYQIIEDGFELDYSLFRALSFYVRGQKSVIETEIRDRAREQLKHIRVDLKKYQTKVVPKPLSKRDFVITDSELNN